MNDIDFIKKIASEEIYDKEMLINLVKQIINIRYDYITCDKESNEYDLEKDNNIYLLDNLEKALLDNVLSLK